MPQEQPAGVREPQTAADLISPRMAGLREPRTAADWFWLGPGHSPDTEDSFPLTQSGGVWEVHGTVAVGPEPEQKGRSRRARAAKRVAISMPREKTRTKQKTFQKRKKKNGERDAAYSV